MRDIHTGFYSNETEYLLTQLLHILDHQPFYMSRRQHRVGTNCKLTRAPNGEILLSGSMDEWYLPFRKLNNDIEARNWIAFQLKLAVQKELQLTHGDSRHTNWKRDNKTILSWFSGYFNADDEEKHDVKLETIYCLYDLMRARQKTDKHYDAKLIEKLVGHENDPFTTEQENVRREEIKRINKEKEAKISALREERYKKLADARVKIEAEYDVLIKDTIAAFDTQIKQLNDTFEEMRKLAAA